VCDQAQNGFARDTFFIAVVTALIKKNEITLNEIMGLKKAFFDLYAAMSETVYNQGNKCFNLNDAAPRQCKTAAAVCLACGD